MSKRFVLHDDNDWDAQAIYVEDTKHDVGENAFMCGHAIVDKLNRLFEQTRNLEGLVEQRNKQIKNLKTDNKHNIEKKNRRIAVLEKALKLASKPRDDWSGKEYDEPYTNYYDYFIDQAEKELRQQK